METMTNSIYTKRMLPNGWRWASLGEVCEPHTGARDPRLQPDIPFKYVDISSVDNKSKRITGAVTVIGKDAPIRARKIIRANDVLVAMTRPNLNAVALVPTELDNQICSTGFCVLRAKQELFPDYLFGWVRNDNFVSSLTDLVKGALYPAVTDAQVKAQEIPLPPPIKQQEIAAILKEQIAAVEKARISAQDSIEAIKALPDAFLRQAFPQPGQLLPEGWRWVKLGEIIHLRSGEFLPASSMDERGKFPVYGGNGVNGLHSSYMFEEPKIVIGRVGALCGCVHLTKPKSWITDNALFVDVKKCPLDDEFLFFLLIGLNLRNLANQMGQPVISSGSIYETLCALPPFPEQSRIAAVLKNQMAMIDKVQKAAEEEIVTINALPASLLRRAFNGDM